MTVSNGRLIWMAVGKRRGWRRIPKTINLNIRTDDTLAMKQICLLALRFQHKRPELNRITYNENETTHSGDSTVFNVIHSNEECSCECEVSKASHSHHTHHALAFIISVLLLVREDS
jgi:hypothetical protein